jgi:rhodanese-related sulfurtransferase
LKILKFLAASLVALFAVTSLAGCAVEKQDPTQYAQIIDVRTPEEWASGHLQGAIRIGIADGDFPQQLEALDKSADYFVYCRSGNRAGQAIEFMKSAGFTGKLVNGGGVGDASSTLGLSVVTD